MRPYTIEVVDIVSIIWLYAILYMTNSSHSRSSSLTAMALDQLLTDIRELNVEGGWEFRDKYENTISELLKSAK